MTLDKETSLSPCSQLARGLIPGASAPCGNRVGS